MRGFVAVLVSGLLFLFSGCSGQEQITEEQVLALIQNLKAAQYELSKDVDLDDAYSVIHENIKPLMTDAAYRNFFANREAYFAVEAAKKGYRIELGEIRLTQVTPEEDGKSLHAHFSLSLVLSSSTDVRQKHATGQVTIVHQNGVWKIDRNWDSLTARDLEDL